MAGDEVPRVDIHFVVMGMSDASRVAKWDADRGKAMGREEIQTVRTSRCQERRSSEEESVQMTLSALSRR